MEAYLSRAVSVLEHIKTSLGKHEPKTNYCQLTCFQPEARDEHRGECDNTHYCGAIVNVSEKNELKMLIEAANNLLDGSAITESHKVVLQSVIILKLEKIVKEAVKGNCDQKLICLSKCFGGHCSDHRECGRKPGEWYNVKNGRTFADYAHATNCTRWYGWQFSCQGHACSGYLVSSSDLNELINVVKGLNTPGFVSTQHQESVGLLPSLKSDCCPQLLNVKDEDQGRMPVDPFPTAVSYVDENAQADVATAMSDAPPATSPGSGLAPPQSAVEGILATEPAHEGNLLRERTVPTSAFDSSDVAHSEASFLSAAGDQRCFLEGTMLPDADGRLVRVEDMQLHHSIRAADGQIVRIAAAKHHLGPHQVVSLQSDDSVLRMTASHRVIVQRGSRQEPAPAKDLRGGEDVVCQFGILRLPTMPVMTEENIPAIELLFSPNLPVETFPPAPENAVLTMGSRPPKRRRRHHVAGDIDMMSMPATDDGFEDHA